MECDFGLRRRGWLLALGCLLLADCNTRVTPMGAAPAALLPRPTMVVVDDFVIDADAVRVDPGIGGVARRELSGQDVADAQSAVTDAVRNTVRETLLKSIAGMDLPVQPGGAATPPGAYVEIRGDVLSIDEGNRTRRNLVGFGAGRSSIQATTHVFYIAPGAPPQLLQTYDANAESGRTPGLGLGAASAAAGAVAGAAVNAGAHAATIGNSDVDADAKRLAERLASNVGSLFAQQGWIPPSAVPSPGLR
jgi:hypothetical protein